MGGCEQACAAEASGDDPRDQRRGRSAVGNIRTQIIKVFEQRHEGEDAHRDGRAHKGEGSAVEVEPSEMRSPADNGRSGESAESAREADAEDEKVMHFRGSLVDIIGW